MSSILELQLGKLAIKELFPEFIVDVAWLLVFGKFF